MGVPVLLQTCPPHLRAPRCRLLLWMSKCVRRFRRFTAQGCTYLHEDGNALDNAGAKRTLGQNSYLVQTSTAKLLLRLSKRLLARTFTHDGASAPAARGIQHAQTVQNQRYRRRAPRRLQIQTLQRLSSIHRLFSRRGFVHSGRDAVKQHLYMCKLVTVHSAHGVQGYVYTDQCFGLVEVAYVERSSAHP